MFIHSVFPDVKRCTIQINRIQRNDFVRLSSIAFILAGRREIPVGFMK